jgi:Ca2+-binding EF-hand superfamily protein
MEKITEDDIALLKEEFKNLDVDKSNSLTAHDINSNREVTLSM